MTLTFALAVGPAPAFAGFYGYGYGYSYGYWRRPRHWPAKHRGKEVAKNPVGDIPKGPLQIFISIDQQKLHLYSDGVHVADTSVATGVPSLPTPLGVFSVIQKQVFHRSNIYSNAPMPFMQRITWSGVAMHEGEGIGHRASHGCIRMPRDFAAWLYHLTKPGVPVIVARTELKPVEFADPHLFVHRDRPPDQIAAKTATSGSPQTAPVADPGNRQDPAPSAAAGSAAPAALGLRVNADTGLVGLDAVADAGKPNSAIDAQPKAAASQPDATAESNIAAPAEQKSEPAAAALGATVPTDVAPATAPAAAAPADSVPTPPAEPAQLVKLAPASRAPIAIFISRKAKKIYVRQGFTPLFQAPVTIADPDTPLGTQVFTALGFAGDDRTTLRWDVVSLPGEPPPRPKRRAERERYERYVRGRRRGEERQEPGELPPPQTPAEALSRIGIPQAAIDYISALIVPGSSLIVSDHGLGEETGEGTNFIVVTR